MEIFMIIIILHSKPYSTLKENIIQSLNEVIIVILCYHLILTSEYVPFNYVMLKKLNSFSMLSIVSLVLFVYISSIIYSLVSAIKRDVSKLGLRIYGVYKKRKDKYDIISFDKSMKRIDTEVLTLVEQ
jgi:hypothetical protein